MCSIYRQAFAAAGRDPNELIVKSHLFPQRTEQGELDWDKTFSTVPAMLEAGVTEFAIAMPIGMTGAHVIGRHRSFHEATGEQGRTVLT